MPKDKLVSNDHRQLRRRLRYTRAAVIALALLTVTSLIATILAWASTSEAELRTRI
jgi:hypothetical protein